MNLTATVCPLEHGGPMNSADVYGHHGSGRTCARVGTSDTWVYGLTPVPATERIEVDPENCGCSPAGQPQVSDACGLVGDHAPPSNTARTSSRADVNASATNAPVFDHEAVVNHECGAFDIPEDKVAEWCVRAEACAEPDCMTRRDEHASENMPHRFSGLDITDHDWKRPTAPTSPRSDLPPAAKPRVQ